MSHILAFLKPSHPRFWLFAPFIILAFLTLTYLAIWQFLIGQIRNGMADNGVTWQEIHASGFPARLTLDLQKPSWQGEGISWQSDDMSVTLMPFNQEHAIVDFTAAHNIVYGEQAFQLAHKGHMASLVADFSGLVRSSMDIQMPRLRGQIGDQSANITAANIDLQMRRQATDAARYDVSVTTQDLIYNDHQTIGRLTAMFDFALNLLTASHIDELIGERIVIDKLNLTRQKLTLAGRGTLVLAANGFVEGKLDLNFINLNAFVDALEEFGLSKPRDRRKILFLGGLGTALAGGTQDRINLPLHFRKGRTYFGDIKLAGAPRWRP